MDNVTIGFIGGGNMARSLIGGLIADRVEPARVIVSEPDSERRAHLQQAYGVRTTEHNQEVVDAAQVVVLAVKPQLMKPVCQALTGTGTEGRLFLSIAAGIREPALRGWLGEQTAIVRAMPNTPALVQSGATALYANPRVTQAQREEAESVLRAVGLTLWLDDESLMDAVTALSGSGPAYFFLVMEALERGAHALGLPADAARLLTLQTAFGAAKMALEADEDCAALRHRVTSPGGTTEQAIAVLQAGGLEALFEQALTAARDRSAALAETLER